MNSTVNRTARFLTRNTALKHMDYKIKNLLKLTIVRVRLKTRKLIKLTESGKLFH